MSKRNILLAAMAALAFVLAGCVTDNGDDAIEVVRVVSGNEDGFQPTELRITAGTTVMWRNMDTQPHTVTADDDSWDSGNLDPGEDWEYTFDEPGEYPYRCLYHGPQVGTIIVEAAGQPDGE